MSKEEGVNDLWHATDPEKYLSDLAAKGEPAPAPCGCGKGLIPLPAHGSARRWRAEWRDADGKQRYKKILAKSNGVDPGGKTYAKAYARAQRAAVAEGRDPFAHKRTRKAGAPAVAEYVETFLQRHEGRAGTVETHESRLRCHVVPALGSVPVDEVTTGACRDFLKSLQGRMKETTRSGVKKSLSALMAAAVEDGHLPGNPVTGIKISVEKDKRGRKAEVRLTWAHVVALAESIDPRYELLVWIGALQGLRAMEATGVRRCDIHPEDGLHEVRWQRRRGQEAPLKTAASNAEISLGPFLADKYRTHLERWRAPLPAAVLRKRERRGLPPIPAEYEELVTVTRYWTPVRQNALARAFTEAKTKARASGTDVPERATFRDLRHFADTVLMAAGVDPRSVQHRMRHGRLAETLDTYGYHLPVIDWENAPASFSELFGLEEPASLPAPARVPRAQRSPAASSGAGGSA